MSAATSVPPSAGLSTRSRPSRTARRSARPRRPLPSGRAPPTPSSRTWSRRVPSSTRAVTAACPARACFAMLVAPRRRRNYADRRSRHAGAPRNRRGERCTNARAARRRPSSSRVPRDEVLLAVELRALERRLIEHETCWSPMPTRMLVRAWAVLGRSVRLAARRRAGGVAASLPQILRSSTRLARARDSRGERGVGIVVEHAGELAAHSADRHEDASRSAVKRGLVSCGHGHSV
jgi:hypothetical protein